MAARIKAEHAACLASQRDALKRALECGRLLLDARTSIQHGAWQAFVVKQCGLSPRTATRYCAIARAFDALPESAREEIIGFSLRKAMMRLVIEINTAADCRPEILPAVVEEVRKSVEPDTWPEDDPEEDHDAAFLDSIRVDVTEDFSERSLWDISNDITRRQEQKERRLESERERRGRRHDHLRERLHVVSRDDEEEEAPPQSAIDAAGGQLIREAEPGREEPDVLAVAVPFKIPDRWIERTVDSLEREVENCCKHHDRFTDEQQGRIVKAARALFERFGTK